MIDFHQDFNNLTIEQLRTRHDKYVEERENLLKKAEKDSASFSPDKQRRLADLSDWIEASEAPRDKRDHATLGGFTGIPTVSASEERNQYLKFGQYLQAVAASGSPAGQRYGMFESGRMYQNILEPEARATGLAESIPSLGGFLVGSDMSNDIFMRVHKTSKVWDLVRKLPISTNANGIKIPTVDETSRANGSRAGGVQAYWIDESGDKTASKPKFGSLELSLKKLVVLCYSTDELLQDAAALGEFIAKAAADEIGFKLDDGVVNGTGGGQLLGLNNANALVSVSKESGQVSDTIIYENVLQMISQFWAAGFENAVWLANQNIIPQLYAMNLSVGTAAVPVYSPANGSSGSKSSLFGRPIIFIEQAPTLGDAGDLILADLTQYIGITKGGIQSASSIHVQFTQDETVFRFVMRCDGQPMWSDSLTPFKGSDSISPYVVIEARE